MSAKRFISNKLTKILTVLLSLLGISVLYNNCSGQGFTAESNLTLSEKFESSETPPLDPNGKITSFELSSPKTGFFPFSVGMGFKKGDAPSAVVLGIANGQVVTMKKWNDGSIKHAIISGHVHLQENKPTTIEIFRGTPTTRVALTAADIVAANPSAVVSLEGLGTVSLASLLSTPIRTFVSGPEMVEAHYLGKLENIRIFFYVRLFKNGQVWIRTSVENGFIDRPNSEASYVASITISGREIYRATLVQPAHTQWSTEGWTGEDPQVIPKHDTIYLTSTRLVPNYMSIKPTPSTLDKLYQAYRPFEKGGWSTNMGNTGYQDQIGLLPLWDAVYITSGGDPRAFRSVTANSQALGSYSIIWRGASDNDLPFRPSAFPSHSFFGPNQGGGNPPGAGPLLLTWESAHHGSAGYLAYLLTGDYLYLETMEHQAGNCYLSNSYTTGLGTSRILKSQVRAAAWCLRTIGQLASLAPSDPLVDSYAELLQKNAEFHLASAKTPGINQLGIIYEYCPGGLCFNSYAPGGSASVFMHDFFVQTFGMVSDLEPMKDMTTWNSVRDWVYKFPVGILGSGEPGTYCYNYASSYTIKAASSAVSDLTKGFQNWEQVFMATFPDSTCGNTLVGTSAGAPSEAATGYWGNLLPAIAYAVDHKAPGALESWNRLSTATNWSNVVLKSGFHNVPTWGVVPRP